MGTFLLVVGVIAVIAILFFWKPIKDWVEKKFAKSPQ
jgi:hypothetical protein